MKRWTTFLSCFLLLAVSFFLFSCGGEQASVPPRDDQAIEAEETEESGEVSPEEAESAGSTIDWYDYQYTFLGAWRNRDLNPQSDVVDYGGDYVHLRVRITRISEAYPQQKTPLQVLLNCGGREYRIFGKDYTKNSYLWRDYTDFPDNVGESHVYIVTMELVPYSRALNTSFSMEQAELVLNGMDWTNMEQPLTTPLARLPLMQLSISDPSTP